MTAGVTLANLDDEVHPALGLRTNQSGPIVITSSSIVFLVALCQEACLFPRRACCFASPYATLPKLAGASSPVACLDQVLKPTESPPPPCCLQLFGGRAGELAMAWLGCGSFWPCRRAREVMTLAWQPWLPAVSTRGGLFSSD